MSLVLGFFSLLSLMFGGEDALQEKYMEYEPPNQPQDYQYQESIKEVEVPLSEDEILLERTLKYQKGEGMRPSELPAGYEHLSKELLMLCIPTRSCSGG